MLDLREFLGAYASPDKAMYADVAAAQMALQVVVAFELQLLQQISAEERPRKLQQDFDNLKAVQMGLMSITRTEREVSR